MASFKITPLILFLCWHGFFEFTSVYSSLVTILVTELMIAPAGKNDDWSALSFAKIDT